MSTQVAVVYHHRWFALGQDLPRDQAVCLHGFSNIAVSRGDTLARNSFEAGFIRANAKHRHTKRLDIVLKALAR